MADIMGRRNLVVLSAALMVVEMLVFVSVPVGGAWAFSVFLVNRVISGAAEAFASGADEALAYDSIDEKDRATVWPRVMARLSRWTALGFAASSLVGAFLYDAEKLNHALEWMGVDHAGLTKQLTLKFPIYLCVPMAVACLGVTLAMREPAVEGAAKSFGENLRASWQNIRKAARWVWRTPVPLLLITLGFLLDSIVRLFMTVSSNYYRYVGISEASFGVISVAVSLAAFFTSGWMEWLVKHRPARFNFALVIAMITWGLLVLAHPVRGWFGVALLAPILLSIRFLQFFLSHYLNEATPSSHRATVLSFRGLTVTLAFGAVTSLFGWQTAFLSGQMHVGSEDPSLFARALSWWPWWFAGTMLAYAALRWWKLRKVL
jgi:hypothetical protein